MLTLELTVIHRAAFHCRVHLNSVVGLGFFTDTSNQSDWRWVVRGQQTTTIRVYTKKIITKQGLAACHLRVRKTLSAHSWGAAVSQLFFTDHKPLFTYAFIKRRRDKLFPVRLYIYIFQLSFISKFTTDIRLGWKGKTLYSWEQT